METIRKKHTRINFKSWLKKNKKPIIIIASLILVVTVPTAMYLINSLKSTKQPSSKKTITIEKQAPKYYTPLTGKLVPDLAATKRPVTGVMIENSPESRPQSGLKDSGIVFEAIAEGGITRFLVLYQSERPQTIGPVRSLRLYDVDWLAAFDSSIAHVGGSAGALSEIRNGSYRDIDQFFNSSYYWRSTSRYAPHNVYTSFDKLDALSSAKGYSSSNFTAFKRADSKPVKKPDASNIDIIISGPLYNTSYKYNPKTNNYARSQGGEAHLDSEDGQITPSVVIAMRVNESTIMEDGNRESIETIGSGEANIFQNGTVIKATWQKTGKLDQIQFTDSNGNEVPLVRGQTWISAVPNIGGDVVWQ